MQTLSELERLVARYGKMGPRYTSYPTAPFLRHEFDPQDVERAFSAAANQVEPLGLYVHVPFCESQCAYCGCNVVPTARSEVAAPYVEALRAEIARAASTLGSSRPLRWLHFGGGTPTYLAPDQLEDLTSEALDRFRPTADLECSVEVDPRVTGREHLEALRRVGVSRLSIGVQDLSPVVQSAIGRNQTVEQTQRCFSQARELGFERINVDLVYGLPHQTAESFAETIDEVVRLRPDRVAVYGYAHVPSMRANQRSIDASALASGLERLQLFLVAGERFDAAGYTRVGMDHFALPHDDLTFARDRGHLGRSFMGYTSYGELDVLGAGVTSIGQLGPTFLQNHKKLAPYYRAVQEGRPPIEKVLVCTREDEERRWVIHRLMCDFRVAAADYEERFGKPFWSTYDLERAELEALVDDGLADSDESGVRVTETGRLFVRNVAMVFDRYLREARQRGAYSSTV